MTPAQARELADALKEAADEAEAQGKDTVDIFCALRFSDDEARAELQAAIDAHNA